MEKQPPLYQIVDWNKHFENSKSRLVEKCGFVCVPNRHGGLGFTNVVNEPGGAAIYGAWVMLLQLCSRQKPKREGWVTQNGRSDGRPITAEEMARMFGIPKVIVYRMLQVVSRSDIEWIKLVSGEAEYKIDEAEYFAELGEKTPEKQQGATPLLDDRSTAARPLPPDSQPLEPPANQQLNGDSSLLDRCSTTARPLLDDCSTTALKEGRNERSTVNKTVPTTKPLLSLSSQKCEEPGIPYAEAKNWLNEIFRNPHPWNHEEEKVLCEVVPIPAEIHRLVDWAYRLPEDSPIHELTRLRQKRISLLLDLPGEADKLRQVRKQMGYGDLVAKKKQPNG